MQSLQPILVRARRFAGVGLTLVFSGILVWIVVLRSHGEHGTRILVSLIAGFFLCLAIVAIGKGLAPFIGKRFRSTRHESILGFKDHRYRTIAGVLSVVATIVYVLDLARINAYRTAWSELVPEWLRAIVAKHTIEWDSVVGANSYGNTTLGITLGWIAAALVLWLMLLGIRKRRFASVAGSLQGQTSAHVYLGLTLLLIGALHCGFEFGWNLHTFVYVVMASVIISGIYGVFAYLWIPRRLTDNLGEESDDSLLEKIEVLQTQCEGMAMSLPNAIYPIVEKARDTRFGGSFRRRLAGNARCATQRACNRLAKWRTRATAMTDEQAAAFLRLQQTMAQKRTLVQRLRGVLRLRALLEVWLYIHVPLSFALLAALIAHIVAVFYYNN